MPSQYIWTPPTPTLPESKPARVSPRKNRHLYYDESNPQVWGNLVHPNFKQHNPFLYHPDDKQDDDYLESNHGNMFRPGGKWRHTEGGLRDAYNNGTLDYEDGVPDPDALERHIRRSINSALPAIAISGHAMHQVLDSGRVKSQFETGTSNGALEPDLRKEVENQYFGYPHDIPNHLRPIYGYLTHDPSKRHPHASQYGSHTLILHRPRIWHRTSAFLGDTLDQMGESHMAHPVQDFKLSGAAPHDWRRLQKGKFLDKYGYTEAQYHGGVTRKDIHYAVLHHVRHGDPKDIDSLAEHLNDRKIPWVRMGPEGPERWEHHLGRLMANVSKGAHMQNNAKVVGQQGPGRYLIDLGYEDEKGIPQGQIADLNEKKLHPPMPKDSILARGYWDEPEFPVDVHDILPHVTPA